ncbi:molybdopterin-binding protein [Kitasatospora paracochleata]|uniref:Molybdopterin molybdenumtransferase n=1 Tax=Kitasatospora paracochleata TaxID=58354 RepID=A0ABT1J8U5_9ACTN|nr:molybdopterin molybdotransferase [Kitasatospora paracochleata]
MNPVDSLRPVDRPVDADGPRADPTLRHAPWPQARRAARRAGAPLPAELLGPVAALGRTLAEPLTALTDLPAFDTSAMDGWAVAGPGPWRLTGRLLAGERCRPLADGEAVEIATGAQLPPGATGVLRREHGRVEPGDAEPGDGGEGGLLRGAVGPGQDVRPRGQECRCGDELLPAGTVVTPAVLGLASAAGHDALTVRRRPTVELLVLGDELQESGLPGPGRVRDALGPLLPPLLAAAGAEVLGRRYVRDDFGLLRDAIRHSPADVVLTTGGTAAGPVDFLHAALEATGGHLLVDGVAVRPGHPMLLAELPGGRRLVGLPGNPLAAVAGTVTLALPLLAALSGRPTGAGRERIERAAVDLPGHPADTRLLPVVRREDGVVPLAFDGPAMLRGLALAEALAVVPPGGVPAGGRTELLTLP